MSMGLCDSASMYICAMVLSAEEEEEGGDEEVSFCGERCEFVEACRGEALREAEELIVTGRRLPGLCAPLSPLRTALMQKGARERTGERRFERREGFRNG